ncbi:uncharacterized protein LOC135389643 [Ornithodoros turicata]|uniref:uncharacterized protein LOC135389643 n=1 Tax=Ornithodoros turicata TaxID=34597 RepID=UPI00313A28D5
MRLLEYEDQVLKMTSLLKAKATEPALNTGAATTASTNPISNGGRSSVVRLPRLQLQTFKGDIPKWPPFWEQFRQSIHENENLSRSEKFQYWRSLLSGPPAAAIAGLQATEMCYQDAIDILTRRFGDQKRIEREHLGKLRIPPVVTSSDDIRGLRGLFDHVQTHRRGLQALGISPSTYAALLVDIIPKALPGNITVVYYRRSARGSIVSAQPST